MDKAGKAIIRIQYAYEIALNAGNDLICAYSGGKDSDVLLDLCKKAGVPFRAEHNHTTADAPETVYHIHEVFSGNVDAKINYPEMTMWELIPTFNTPPLALASYCCSVLKERRFNNQHLLMGVRWCESNTRKANRGLHEKLGSKRKAKHIYLDENDDKRKLLEICQTKNRVATNPIVDWTVREIWEYVHKEKIKMNPLYSYGFDRVGCVGCPKSGKKGMNKTLARYPKIKAAYVRAFDKMLIERAKREKPTEWKTGLDVYKWWTIVGFNPSQLTLEDVGYD